MEKQLNTKRLSERPRRTALDRRSRLSVKNTDPNYQYRIVNCNLDEDPDRVEDMIERGYEIVPSKKAGQVGDAQVNTPSALGSAGQISVGRGTKAVVMRIPREYYEEDQKIKQAENDALEQRSKKSADYGTVTFETKRTPE
jgi:hypothetical protein